jgi:ABC-2 type transport system ATP-binding protein
VLAVDALDLRVRRAEVFGYLGPNGAGKSTSIRLLLGLIRPSAGRAALLGLDSQQASVEARRHIGYLPGDLRLADRLTGREQLDSLGRLRGAKTPLRDELCGRFGAVLDRPDPRALQGQPPEARAGAGVHASPGATDPRRADERPRSAVAGGVRALLRESAADGRTVFLSSHSLDEVQHAADRVGVIRGGKLLDVDSVAALRERALRHVTIVFADAADAGAFARIDGVRIHEQTPTLVRLSAPESAMDAVVKTAALAPVADLVSSPADLEEIFLELYRGDDERS